MTVCRVALVMEPFLMLCLLFETLLMLHAGECGVLLRSAFSLTVNRTFLLNKNGHFKLLCLSCHPYGIISFSKCM